MAKIVYGKYDTTEEALQAVNALKYKGANGSDITIMADKADRLQFTKEEPNNDVDTEAARGESFMDKIASFFMLDSTERIEDRLIAKGIDAQESERLANDVENGKILILVDEGTAGVLHSELDDETPNRGGLYAARNEEKRHNEKGTPETVGNMSRSDHLEVTDELTGTADGRMRNDDMSNNDDLGSNRRVTDNQPARNQLRNEDARLRDDTQSGGPVRNMNRKDDVTVTDDLSVTADDRLREPKINDDGQLDRDQTFTAEPTNTDKLRNEEKMSEREDRQTKEPVGNMSRTDNLSVTDSKWQKEDRMGNSNRNDEAQLERGQTFTDKPSNTDKLRNEEKMSEREGRQTKEPVGNMSRADDLSVTDSKRKKEGRLRDSNMNENDDLDKKKTYPDNRIDTDNL